MDTILSIAIFSVATLVLFSFMNEFIKVYNKQDEKSSTNTKFTKAYRTIDEDLSLASTDYFDFYGEKDVDRECRKHRWFLYANAQNKSSVNTDKIGSIQWDKITLFYLVKPKDGCTDYEYCPHKSLMKAEYYLTNLSQKTLDNTINTIVTKKLKNFLVLPGETYPTIKETEFKGITKVCDGLIDLRINYYRGYCKFELYALRESEAKKHISIGNVKLLDYDDPIEPEESEESKTNVKYIETADPTAVPFIEKIGWTTANKNI